MVEKVLFQTEDSALPMTVFEEHLKQIADASITPKALLRAQPFTLNYNDSQVIKIGRNYFLDFIELNSHA